MTIHSKDSPVRAIDNLMGQAHVDLDTFQAAAIRGGADFVFEHLVPALQAIDGHFQELEHGTAQHRVGDTVAKEYGFLRAVAAISPDLDKFMQAAGLVDLQTQQILADTKKLAAMRSFLNYVLQTENLKTLHMQLAKRMQEFYSKQHQSAVQKAHELRHCHAQHQEPAHAEYSDLGVNAINNARSNEMFDPIKVIGHLLSALFELYYKAPLRNLLYPHVKHDYTPVNMNNDPKLKLSTERYGGLLEPSAAVPAGLPAGMKLGGPAKGM